MDPSGPSQPPKTAAYTSEGNAVTSDPMERDATRHHTKGGPVEERFPPSQAYRERIEEEAMPTSLACGIVGTPPGEVRLEGEEGQVGRSRELEGEQMRAPGEGEVADAVHRRPGASGSQPDLASDLDRKKAEQAPKREAVLEARHHGALTGQSDPRAAVRT